VRPAQQPLRVTEASLVLGILFWISQCTDYSWAGTWPNILFPPVVAYAGWIAFRAAKDAPTDRERRIKRLLSLPALLGGTIWVGIILVLAGTMLGLIPLSQVLAETRIQEAISPDATRVADVYFRPVGAVGNGSGYVLIRVKHRLFPFVEREVWVGSTFMGDSRPMTYLSWADNDTLYIPEYAQLGQPKYDDHIKVGLVSFQVPPLFTFPAVLIAIPVGLYMLFGFLLWHKLRMGDL